MKSFSLAAFVRRHWGSWGIPIFALWALVLAFLSFARLLLLTRVVQLGGEVLENQSMIWLVFIFNTAFGLGFTGSAYGLWRRRNWGRVLFLWWIVIWSGFNWVAVFFNPALSSNQEALISNLLINGLRLAVGVIISMWYFNMPHIKALFDTDTPEQFTIEE